jgi:hypothetical protein
MITQEEAKDFIRRYREVVLETPSGEVHVCGSKDVYEELIGQGKLAFSPNELIHLQKAAENGSLETIVKIKSSILGARIKDIIRWRKSRRQHKSRTNLMQFHRRILWKGHSSKR